MLELRQPLRRQTYVNSGFIAMSTEHWPDFLSRFWEVCGRIPPHAAMIGQAEGNPFWAADQDALNALLMSEISPDEVLLLPAAQEVHPDRLRETKIVDAATLSCSLDGEPPAILHYAMPPKASDRSAWVRVRRDAYVRLFTRLVCGEDVTLRLRPKELPVWLRGGHVGRIVLGALDVTHGVAASIRRLLPPPLAAAVLRTKNTLARSTRW